MALSGVMLPSFSTFTNQREKTYENRWKGDMDKLVSNSSCSMLEMVHNLDNHSKRDDEDLNLDFILANTTGSDSTAEFVGTADPSMYTAGITVPSYPGDDHRSPPPPYGASLMTELLRSEGTSSYDIARNSCFQGRFYVNTAHFPRQEIKVEPLWTVTAPF
ncbi:hypothetical protein F7725_011236 [Dissostichus mawsoni]|uniref:Uncharacterized protein n=1 Tax=Dissostichus mawsoni TaxID=36200 RepID=A0A7J5Z8G3_DISMA|nr:hypothetical protein F7725_011236 [Dissostichus mawsoni]